MTRHRGVGLRAVVLRKGGRLAVAVHVERERHVAGFSQPLGLGRVLAGAIGQTSPFDTIRSELTNVKRPRVQTCALLHRPPRRTILRSRHQA